MMLWKKQIRINSVILKIEVKDIMITPVNVSSDCLYMWTISDVNIGELDYFDFSYY